MSVAIKAVLRCQGGSEPDIRRFQISAEDSGSFDNVVAKVGENFPALEPGSFSVFWKDNDGKQVAISTDGELKQALGSVGEGILKLHVQPSNQRTGSDIKKTIQTEEDLMKKDDTNGSFVPTPQFRRWMQRFLKRWHIRHAPSDKGPVEGGKSEKECTESSNKDQENVGVIEEFIQSVEGAMTSLVHPLGQGTDEENDVETNDDDVGAVTQTDESVDVSPDVGNKEQESSNEAGKQTGKRQGCRKGSAKKRDAKKDSNQEGFVPSPQFRRWMRKFMKRWHIRHAPSDKGEEQEVKEESKEQCSGNEQEDSAVAEFMQSIEDVVTAFTDKSTSNGEPNDDVSGEIKENEENQTSENVEEATDCAKQTNTDNTLSAQDPNSNSDKVSKQGPRSGNKKRFVPSPHFRRWIRRFVKRWHIRHAPSETKSGKPEDLALDPGTDEQKPDKAVEEFLNAVEDAMTSFGDPSANENAKSADESNGGDKSVNTTKDENPASDTDNIIKAANAEQASDKMQFVPSPQFRRWMRRFMKRWHIRHAPCNKGAEQCVKDKPEEQDPAKDGKEIDDAVAEFIKAVEEAVASFVGSSDK